MIPVLDEALALPATLARLDGLRARGVEVVVVDGGSTDSTLAEAEAAGVVLTSASRGRARQMNAGAGIASSDILLFLHADTWLPERADEAVAVALSAGRNAWGRFDVRITGRSWLLPPTAWLMNRRSRLTGIATGDQAIFMTRQAYDEVGGFPDQPLMEDVEMSSRLRRRFGRPACPTGFAVTSGRRWEERGVVRTILLMWRLRFAYWRGVPPSRLAEAYR